MAARLRAIFLKKVGGNMDERAKKIIDNHIRMFIDSVITRVTDITNRGLIFSKSQFEIFNLVDNAFFESVDKEKSIESLIQEELVANLISNLFDLYNIKYFIPNANYCRPLSDTKAYDKAHDFIFIVDEIGYKFSREYRIPYACFKDELEEFYLKKYSIKEVKVLSFSNEIHEDFQEVSIEDFIKKYFDEEIWQYYYSSSILAIEEVRQMYGFTTMKNLNLRNLSKFKEYENDIIEEYDYYNAMYIFKNDNKYTRNLVFSNEDKNKLIDRFVSKKLYEALMGNNEFSKCFITAEYLYHYVKNQKCFDYTSIVCGYIKSVEGLLHTIYKSYYPNENVRYDMRNEEYFSKNPGKDILKYKKGPYGDLYFRKDDKYKGHLEMKDLVMALLYCDSCSDLSLEGKKIIYEAFKDYRKTCRNGYFHLDNLYKKNDVDRIRTNTIICLFYLLGGFKLNPPVELNVFDSSYSKLYEKIRKLPMAINKFLININDNSYKVLLPQCEKKTCYDVESGAISSCMNFIVVDDFKCGIDLSCEFDINEYDILTLGPSNMPQRIYWIDMNEVCHEICWENKISDKTFG